MITELEVSGYKGLDGVKLTDLKRILLIGGRNNTGKTSLLEAFFASLDWANPELLSRHLNWRGIEVFLTSPDSAWSPSFTNFNMKGKIQIKTRIPSGERYTFTAQVTETTGATVPTPPTVDDKVNIRAPAAPTLRLTYTKGSKPVFEAQVTATGRIPPYSIKASKMEETPPTARFVIARMRTGAVEDANNFGRLDQEKRTEELIQSLHVIEPKLRGLSIIPVGPQSQLFADIEGFDRKIPVNLLGDGITRLLSILLQISNATGGYILLDEIENGFHYSAMPKVWQTIYTACKARRCQLIATTHSYECLTAFANSLGEAAPDDYSYARLQRDDGKLKVTQYDAQAIRDAVANGWEVR
jgi:hypothetical protein